MKDTNLSTCNFLKNETNVCFNMLSALMLNMIASEIYCTSQCTKVALWIRKWSSKRRFGFQHNSETTYATSIYSTSTLERDRCQEFDNVVKHEGHKLVHMQLFLKQNECLFNILSGLMLNMITNEIYHTSQCTKVALWIRQWSSKIRFCLQHDSETTLQPLYIRLQHLSEIKLFDT